VNLLPILPGTPARATHDYERHGTSSLFAALNTTSGKVIRSLHNRHRAIEFKSSSRRSTAKSPPSSTCT
jgi:hypothetical protein